MHPRWSSRTTPSTAASSRACTSSGGWAAAGMAGSTEAHVGVIMHIAQPLVGRVPCAGSQQLSFAGLSPAIRDSAYVALGSAACVWAFAVLAAPPEHLGAALQLRRVPAGSYPGLTLCPPSFLRYRAGERTAPFSAALERHATGFRRPMRTPASIPVPSLPPCNPLRPSWPAARSTPHRTR